MKYKLIILGLCSVALMTVKAEFSPSGARHVFDAAPESIKSEAFEKDGCVFIPAKWVITGKLSNDRKAELMAYRESLIEYLAKATNQDVDKLTYNMEGVRSVVVKTAVVKRQRQVVVAYDAEPILAYIREHKRRPLWRRIIFFWE